MLVIRFLSHTQAANSEFIVVESSKDHLALYVNNFTFIEKLICN